MDIQTTKKLNKQGLWFVVLHTVFILNLAFDILSIH